MGIFSHFFGTTQESDGIAAVWALRDIHIDASLADDMATATLANLLITPTPAEFLEVNGVTVDISSPEYAAWYREHYG